MMASLILPYDISIQITGNYNSKRVITQGYRKPSFGIDFGLRKNFFNKALTLAVNWRGDRGDGPLSGAGREHYH